jgi:hypothetical protein
MLSNTTENTTASCFPPICCKPIGQAMATAQRTHIERLFVYEVYDAVQGYMRATPTAHTTV